MNYHHFYYHLLTASAICVLTGFASSAVAVETPVPRLPKEGNPVHDTMGMSAQDRDLLRQVRLEIAGDPQLSVAAKNISINVNDGKVTLSGPVSSQAQIIRVIRHAHAVAGATNVINNMEIVKH